MWLLSLEWLWCFQMSKGETVKVSSTGGRKAGNLERYDLIPAEPLRQLAEHFGKGAEKYDENNWRRGYDWGASFAALNRHLWQFWAGEDVDPETGSNHMVAVAWHAFALLQFMQDHPEFDTRFKGDRKGAPWTPELTPPADFGKAPDGLHVNIAPPRPDDFLRQIDQMWGGFSAR